ncbi:hypothetical protein PRIPAC_79335 [Pristionchus pacificus]|uniref:Uncharacterized protein n=1 Tax=Pristionchus pacificus TaxID=54126 RepID=A0A2A6BX79_PRIPA|nr:hypothetical protein PRIPAC_79335 [Pristionchus pacificus]|eukprot:PDM70457.1 hypothetical protein PRIPAC_46703 [Pristionchus pacificus]
MRHSTQILEANQRVDASGILFVRETLASKLQTIPRQFLNVKRNKEAAVTRFHRRIHSAQSLR